MAVKVPGGPARFLVRRCVSSFEANASTDPITTAGQVWQVSRRIPACCAPATLETFCGAIETPFLNGSLNQAMTASKRERLDDAKLVRAELRLAEAHADELIRRAEAVLQRTRPLRNQ